MPELSVADDRRMVHAGSWFGSVTELAGSSALMAAPQPSLDHTLSLVGRAYADPDAAVEAGAEIVAYDAELQRLYVSNGDTDQVDVFDISDPSAPEKLFSMGPSVNVDAFDITSVTVSGDLVAVTYDSDPAINISRPGVVSIFRKDGTLVDTSMQRSGPDSAAFTPDGRTLIVANEGEVDEEDGTDPRGSIRVLSLDEGGEVAGTRIYDFAKYVGREDELRADGVRITAGKNAPSTSSPSMWRCRRTVATPPSRCRRTVRSPSSTSRPAG